MRQSSTYRFPKETPQAKNQRLRLASPYLREHEQRHVRGLRGQLIETTPEALHALKRNAEHHAQIERENVRRAA